MGTLPRAKLIMPVSKNNANLDDELLSAYIDGELTDEERAAVEARLESDPAARELVAEMRSLSSSLKSLPREVLAEDLRGAVLQQVGDSLVSLPAAKLSMARRLMWPAIAIAAALLLMFVQNNREGENGPLAKVDVPAAERRERDLSAGREAAFEAPEKEKPQKESRPQVALQREAGQQKASDKELSPEGMRQKETPALAPAAEPDPAALAAPAPPASDRALVAEANAPSAESAIAVLDAAADESAARRMTEAMVNSGAELEGVVHLTLTDFRTGAERFNQLLISNGVQLVDEQPPPPAPMGAPTSAAAGEAAMSSTRSAAPAGGLGGHKSELASEEKAQQAEPEMVLVEAPPAQIEQILVGCAKDTEAIEDVTVDPTASGMNNAPAAQRLSEYQQYSRSSVKLSRAANYGMTPEQQNAIAVFNSVPKQAEPLVEGGENQQQGWAARFYAGQQPVQKDQLNWQYNRYRDQYFSNQVRRQGVARSEHADQANELAKDQPAPEEPLRVLFLLHPSHESAKK